MIRQEFMYLLQANASGIIDWHMLWFGENDLKFVIEVMLRSFIMFTVSLVTLRLLGKRGVKQRLFEIVVVITLGSAAGDAMFYKDVGLIPAISVFVMIVIMYKLISFLVVKNSWLDTVIEGQPEILIKDGAFNYEVYKKQMVAQDEFLADLRLKNISQLGQVRLSYLEDSGELSVFYYEDEEVKFGMPVYPIDKNNGLKVIIQAGMYSCMHCAHTLQLPKGDHHKCVVCDRQMWRSASNEKRVQ